MQQQTKEHLELLVNNMYTHKEHCDGLMQFLQEDGVRVLLEKHDVYQLTLNFTQQHVVT